MRFSNLATILVGAGLAVQAGASPLRIVISEGSSAKLLFTSDGEIANVKYNHWQSPPLIKEGGRRGCNKAVALSNKFREFFGMPLIELENKQEQTDGFAHILPFPPHELKEPVWVNEDGASKSVSDEDMTKLVPVRPDGRRRHRHHHPHPPPATQSSFWRRIQVSLLALGPWEGRAVAFVLGCGIGVLLRMIFVLTIVVYRAVRGRSEESEQYEHLVFDQDAEQILVAPPQYTTYSDEKVAVPVEAEEERK